MVDTGKLYKEIFELISTAPVSELLTRTLLLAQELENKELEDWVKLELNGYFNTNPALTDETVVPEYRTIVGQYSNVYGVPLIIEDPKLHFIQEDRLRHGASELEQFYNSKTMLKVSDPSRLSLIKQKFNVEVHYFSFPPSSIGGILISIRTELLSKLKSIKPLIQQKAVLLEMQTTSLILENFHPAVKQVSEKLFQGGHYRQAILDTYIALVNAVKAKSARYDFDGSKLMQTVFSANNPILTISGNPDEQMGFMWLFSGSVMGIRNPKAHKIDEHPSEQETLEILGFASLLFRALDKARIYASKPHC